MLTACLIAFLASIYAKGKKVLVPTTDLPALEAHTSLVAKGDTLAGEIQDAEIVDPMDAVSDQAGVTVPIPVTVETVSTESPTIESPLPGISDRKWTDYVLAMRSQKVSDVSPSNDVGMFSMKTKRLADLGLVKGPVQVKAPNGRNVWAGVFIPPMTANKFLTDPLVQYKAFVDSNKDYANKIGRGEIARPSEDMSLSGMLAVLHRCGPKGLESWSKKKLPDTEKLVSKVNNIF